MWSCGRKPLHNDFNLLKSVWKNPKPNPTPNPTTNPNPNLQSFCLNLKNLKLLLHAYISELSVVEKGPEENV